MEAPTARACPSCSAPAQRSQRWCLECGAELPQSRRGGLRPAVGIATTLAVLVGAASAGGYTLLQSGKEPPPPAKTVAQAPVTTPPPATQEPGPSTYTGPSYPLPDTTYPSTPAYGGATTPTTTTTTTTTTSTTPNGGAGDGGAGTTTTGGTGENGDNGGAATTPPPPRTILANAALGAIAIVYAPYAPTEVDLGDPSRVADGSTRTVWKTPAVAAGASPQAGVYIDLASRQTVHRLVVKTATPGIDFEVYGAVNGPPEHITDRGWDHLATREHAAARSSIDLHDASYRYVLVWVTGLPADVTQAAISEVALLAPQPE